MKTRLELDLDNTEAVRKIIQPSLDTDRRVNYSLESEEQLCIEIQTDALGVLRGSTDTAFRLAMLANKIY